MSSVAAERKWCGLHLFGVLIVLSVVRDSRAGDALSLNNQNIESMLQRYDVIFVNFYADWCRFSQILAPIFDEASRKISEEFPGEDKVLFAKVDCDNEGEIAARYHISKYPTLKLFRYGEVMKKEYRGQRTADALANFIRDELKDPVEEHTSLDQLEELNKKKRNFIGYFESKESENYKTFSRVANLLRNDCGFHVAFGDVSATERTGGDKIAFRSLNSENQKQDEAFVGPINNFELLNMWTYEKCVPLVREITFENAEELTEEGLPFLLLFHHPEDRGTVEMFNNEVAKQLLTEKKNVNFLVADGTKFTHPLHHLGKSLNDLPLLAIDSFRHMYVFPHDVKTDLEKPGLLKQFVDDLHSGKLHREYHHGPDPTPTPTPAQPSPPSPDTSKTEEQAAGDREETKETPSDLPKEPEQPKETPSHLPKEPDQPEQQQQQQQQQQQPRQKQTLPPESTFIKLAPSRNRYTILRDEL